MNIIFIVVVLWLVVFVGTVVRTLTRKESITLKSLLPFWEIISANAKKIISVKTNIKFDLIQNSLCFSFKECMDGCVCLACENIDNYEEYPEDGRLVFSYGQSFDSVEDKLGAKKIFLI